MPLNGKIQYCNDIKNYIITSILKLHKHNANKRISSDRWEWVQQNLNLRTVRNLFMEEIKLWGKSWSFYKSRLLCQDMPKWILKCWKIAVNTFFMALVKISAIIKGIILQNQRKSRICENIFIWNGILHHKSKSG